MKIRAVIFDVYQTLLEVGPPPAHAARRWRTLWRSLPPSDPPPSFRAFTARCDHLIRQAHAVARHQGIAWPEVCWPDVVRQAAPALRALPPAALEDWLFAHAQLLRTIRLFPGAADVLRFLSRAGVPLGIASNAQLYTWRELDAALHPAGLSRACFDPDLCFWSFTHGFSKPDPHVFRILTARLAARGIPARAILMVGDRLDNDVQPARAAGWQAWHLRPAGDWAGLAQHLVRHLPAAAARAAEVRPQKPRTSSARTR